MLTGTCATTAAVADALGVGFRTCTADCVGASVTDAVLAAHAALALYRLGPEPQTRCALRGAVKHWMLINCLWSATGALMWWQPGGQRHWWFEPLWRANALSQAALLWAAWQTLGFLLDATQPFAPAHDTAYTRTAFHSDFRGLRRLGCVHALFFGVSTLTACTFEEYVLFGGSNISPPLVALWALILWLYGQHSKRSPSPLLLGAVSGGMDLRQPPARHPLSLLAVLVPIVRHAPSSPADYCRSPRARLQSRFAWATRGCCWGVVWAPPAG